MNKEQSGSLAWLGVGLVLILFAGGVFFAFLSREVPLLDHYQTWQGGLIGAIPSLAYLFVGLLITVRLPDNRFGWVLILFAAIVFIKTFIENFGIYRYYVAGGSQSEVVLTAGLTGIFWFSTIAMLAFILLLFPNGRYFSSRWGIVGWVVMICVAFGNLAGIFAYHEMTFVAPVENPLNVSGAAGETVLLLSDVTVYTVFVCIVLGSISILFRFIRARGAERQQFKWIAFAALIFGVFVFVDPYTELPGLWESVKEALWIALIPTAIGIAIMRYRLYDIDVIIRRTLIYAILTGLLVLVYFGGVTLLGNLFSAVSHQESAIAIVISTLAIAALFNPLRRRIQGFIDRRFYRKKYDGEKALAEFAVTTRDEVDAERLIGRLVGVVAETIQPVQISIWLKESNAETQNR